MALPAAVVEAGRAADEAIDALVSEAQETVDSALDVSFIDESGQTPTVPAVEQHDQAVSSDDLAVVSDPAPLATPVDVDYKHKYQTLLGKYQAEVPRLQHELKAVRGVVERLTQLQPSSVNTPPAAAPAADVDYDAASTKYLKKSEVDEYGAELLGVYTRVARGVAEAATPVTRGPSEEVSVLETRIARLEAEASSAEAVSFWDAVEQRLPGAQETNLSDPTFHAFLDAVDPLSGRPNRELGQLAVDAGDVRGMLALMGDFYKQYRVVDPGASAPTAVSPAPAERPAPRVRPAVTAARGAPAGGAKGVIRESTVSTFYDDVVRGRYKDRPEVRKRREAEIDSALAEGRIVPG